MKLCTNCDVGISTGDKVYILEIGDELCSDCWDESMYNCGDKYDVTVETIGGDA